MGLDLETVRDPLHSVTDRPVMSATYDCHTEAGDLVQLRRKASRQSLGETDPDPIRSEAKVGNREPGKYAEVVACPHAPYRFVEGEGAGADVEGGPV